MATATTINFGDGLSVTDEGAGAITVAAAAVAGGYGTALPGSPTNGQEFTLVDSTTNPTYQWRFRYNAGSSSAYKWEFVGGAAATHSVAAAIATTSVSFVDATGGPTLTVPRAGDYDAYYGGELYGTGNQYSHATIKKGAAAYAEADGVRVYPRTTDTDTYTATRSVRCSGLAASDVIKMGHKTDGGSATVAKRWLVVTPVRVS